MKVKELMTFGVKTCTTCDTLSHAAALMATDGCGFIPIVDAADGSGDLEGVVTDRDIVLAAFREDKPLSAIPSIWRCRVR